MQTRITVTAPDGIESRLRRHGIHPTTQRLRIAQLLCAAPQHLTVEQLLATLRGEGGRISKATVYNTLHLFAERGLVRPVVVDGSRAWFDSTVAPHHHFHDLETGALTDVPLPDVEFQRLPPAPEGMEYAGIDVVIRLRRKPAG